MLDIKGPLLGEPTKDQISLIQDPFLLSKVRNVNINCAVINGTGRWNGEIQFGEGLTSGMQITGPCKDFEEVVQKIRAILNEVQRK